ncbi:hypothetical protein Vretimale_6220 [Volvox reticuliferus]|uniref:MPN domain-containing protein n=1 Tax=Volvox reticuliferus TaxID=1737510 RepID=A0A8J4CH81_9CHLO|nr:hypothetical protein Vretifemale_8030 [Volvox reticuliferus]GIM01396.1 hypothetical protein Vretimale_6220 [Volvox reticuliferus]
MSLERVEVTQEVLLAVLAHAHSTESEEVMGLLLGDVLGDVSSGGGAVCRVSLTFPQIRTDRRKDRVETSAEQMARCSAHAERLSRETGLRIRVVGWYHSHPHITVLPSHVDVRTQAMYQLLDPGFVGLIVSTFNRDAASQASTVQMTAFQSLPDGVGTTGAAGAFGGAGEPMAPSVRKEIRVSVVPSVTSLEKSFSDFLAVQRILLMEETEVYKKALALAAATASATGGGSSVATTTATAMTLSGPSLELTEVHHAGVYVAHMVRLVETSLRPALMSMATLVSQQRVQERQLRDQVAQLETMVAGHATGRGAGPAVGTAAGMAPAIEASLAGQQ